MDENDKLKEEHPFPEGLEYIEELVSEARAKADEIDKQLDKTPREFEKPKPYVPRYNPPEFLQSPKQTNPVNVVYNLENQKAEIEAGINRRVEREIDNLSLDPDSAKQLREATFHKMNPNVFEGKSDREMEGIRKAEKDLNYSQDYMRQLKTNFKAQENFEKKQSAPAHAEQQKEQKEFSMSARFSQTLSYTKVKETMSPDVAKGKSKEKGKNDLTK